MIGAVSSGIQYFDYGQYAMSLRRAAQVRQAGQEAQKAAQSESQKRTGEIRTDAKSQSIIRLGKAAEPGVPVEPVDKVDAVRENATDGMERMLPFMRKGADPAEMAVRMRMQQYDIERQNGKELKAAELSQDRKSPQKTTVKEEQRVAGQNSADVDKDADFSREVMSVEPKRTEIPLQKQAAGQDIELATGDVKRKPFFAVA